MKRIASLFCFLFLFTVPLNYSYAEDQKIIGDPFTDFSDFDTSEEEESIERFYAYGRFIHLSMVGEVLNVTGGMSSIYTTGFFAKARLSYFFDWNIAIIVNGGLGLSQMQIPVRNDTGTDALIGDARWINVGAGVKYYFNFQEISKVIAFLNPSLSLGGGLWIRTDIIDEASLASSITMSGFTATAPFDQTATAPEVFIGGGLEFPLYEKSIYLGLEFAYHLTFFSSTNPNLDYTESDDNPIYKNVMPIDYSGYVMTFGLQLIWNLN